MTAGSRSEYQQRHGVEATPELLAAQVEMSLEFVADGRAEGVVTYCLNKRPGNPDLDAVAEIYRRFRDEHMQEH